MTKKEMSEKLVGAVRAAKTQSSPVLPDPKPKPNHPLPGVTGGADQSDQPPVPSLDHPWENLHPERIWPD